MKKVLLVVLVLVFAVAAFAGCSQPAAETPASEAPASEAPASEAPAEAPAEEPAAEEPAEEPAAGGDLDYASLNFGYLCQTQVTEYMLMVQEGVKAGCEELGINLTVNDADGDPAKQVSQCESMIASGMDAILVSAVDADASAPVVDKCAEAGIPCIAVTNLFNSVNPATSILSDDVEAGRIATRELCEAIGGAGQIGVIRGLAGQSSEVFRGQGMEEVLANEYPDVELVADDIGNWARDEGMVITENWIQKYGEDLKGIFAQNDEMGIGAANAIENAGMTGKIQITAVDCVADAQSYIESGAIYADIAQDPHAQGYEGVMAAVKILKGETVEELVYTPLKTVNKDNVAEHYGA